MYQEKLVASIKANGKILREFNHDTVYVPYGTEYTILLKNLNTIKCLINVFIDSKAVTEGGLVLRPGQELELERSIVNNNLDEGNKFKFVERTERIEKHRGQNIEDGFVRVDFQWEKQDYSNLYSTMIERPPIWKSNVLRSTGNNDFIGTSLCSDRDIGISCSVQNYSNDIGITVPGSISKQKFQEAERFNVETIRHSFLFRLLGETADNESIRTPVTTKHKPVCVTCGTKNKATAKFCSECGTGLKVIA